MDYDLAVNSKGEKVPTPAHHWERQFVVDGIGPGGPPPAHMLELRIKLLDKYIANALSRDVKPLKVWVAEKEWRQRQLKARSFLDSGDEDGDSEHPQ